MCFGCLSLFSKIVGKQLKNQNEFRHPKHNLSLLTRSQKCIFSELQPIELTMIWVTSPCGPVESSFTTVLYLNSSFCLIHMISAISHEITPKLTSFSLKNTINGENYHLRISCFKQITISEITFMLNSRKFQQLSLSLVVINAIYLP